MMQQEGWASRNVAGKVDRPQRRGRDGPAEQR